MQPADVTRAFFEGFWNEGDDSVFERLVAPDVAVRNRFAGEPFTRADLAALHGGLRRLFAGVHVAIEDVIEDGERVAAVIAVEGQITEGGDAVGFEGLTMQRVRGGRIVEDLSRFDTHEVMIRLGLADPGRVLAGMP